MNPKALITQTQQNRMAKYARDFTISITLCAMIAVTLDVICYVILGETSAGTWYNKFWMGFFFCCAFIASSFVILRDKLDDKPECLYLIIALTVSVFMAWSLSLFIVGWDTAIHFRNVLGWADLDDQFELSQSELAFVNFALGGTAGIDYPITLENLYHLEAWLNANDGESVETRTAYSFRNILTHINYVPCAIVMFFCELADLSFSTKYFLALLPSPIIYSIVTFFGMRKLRSGKMLYAVIALLPTMVFLTANYGYQYWNVSLFMYGFACLASFMQRKEIVPLKEITFMLVAMMLAALPRLSYAPLILLALLTPRCCFASKKQSTLFRTAIMAATMLAAAIYAAPRLMSDSGLLGSGDSRGGSNINPSEQLDYILSNPIGFALRLLEFLGPPSSISKLSVDSGILTPSGSIGFIGSMSHLGFISQPLFIAILITLAFTTLTDKKENTSYGWIPGTACVTTSLLTLVAITTCMYMDFNNVGEDAFRGVQSRYLLPFVYPALAFVGSSKWELNGKVIPSRTYNGAVLGLMAAILMASWWQVYLSSVY